MFVRLWLLLMLHERKLVQFDAVAAKQGSIVAICIAVSCILW